MNYKMVFSTIGRMLRTEAFLMLLPIVTALIYQDAGLWPFVFTAVLALLAGELLTRLVKPQDHVIYAREGFAIVALAWITVSAVGALPFVISGEIPSYVDAFFETVSGFTTTGASIVTDVESLSHSILMWRSFTHWVGGMGVLVFIMAVVPNVSDRSIHIMRAEMPGPVVGKLVPRVKDTAKILYIIYIVFTLTETLLLLCGGMSVFESLVHAFGTAGTGGFGIKADSIGGYSPYLQWVITIFMFIFGINFNLYYLILIGQVKTALKSEELWTYTGIVVVCTALITANILPIYQNFSEAVRLSAFQVAGLITTTGYATADFNLWPLFSKTILLLLMFLGGCAGSTAGGLKLSRFIMLLKLSAREIKQLIHPRTVKTIRFEGKPVEEATLSGVSRYFGLYMLCILVTFFLLSFEKTFDIETNFSAAVSCFNNIGPALGLAGPASSYAAYSDFSKVVLSVAMLLGRLEVYPLLIALVPSTWTRNRR